MQAVFWARISAAFLEETFLSIFGQIMLTDYYDLVGNLW